MLNTRSTRPGSSVHFGVGHQGSALSVSQSPIWVYFLSACSRVGLPAIPAGPGLRGFQNFQGLKLGRSLANWGELVTLDTHISTFKIGFKGTFEPSCFHLINSFTQHLGVDGVHSLQSGSGISNNPFFILLAHRPTVLSFLGSDLVILSINNHFRLCFNGWWTWQRLRPMRFPKITRRDEQQLVRKTAIIVDSLWGGFYKYTM